MERQYQWAGPRALWMGQLCPWGTQMEQWTGQPYQSASQMELQMVPQLVILKEHWMAAVCQLGSWREPLKERQYQWAGPRALWMGGL
eukprot:scaffold5504_cov88-Amphora_coffeaeformis.AAC.2